MSSASFPEHLLAACRRGEPAAQEALYAWFAPRLLAVCGRYCRSNAQAEDLVQETFVRVFQLLPTFRGAGVLDAWVRRPRAQPGRAAGGAGVLRSILRHLPFA